MKKTLFTLSFIIITLITNAQILGFQWNKQIGGISNDESRSVVVDASGNVYSTGLFRDIVDFDPGPGTATLAATFNSDIYILKLDAQGNFLWVKQIKFPTINGAAYKLELDNAGGLYAGGFFGSVIDFDPGPGTYTLSAGGNTDAFILKLDVNGNFVWVKSMGGPNGDGLIDMSIDASNNIYSTGTFSGTADFDPGSSTYNLTSTGSVATDIYISKLDMNGNFVWAKRIGDTNYESAEAITTSASGDVILTGSFLGTPDFDPGAGTFSLTANQGFNAFILKLDASGNFTWAKNFTSLFSGTANKGQDVAVDAAGNIYSVGNFNGTVDFDPGTASYTLACSSGTNPAMGNTYVTKLDAAGNFVWAKNMSGKNAAWACTLDHTGSILTTGLFYGMCDFDPAATAYNLTAAGTTTTYPDIFISKLDNNGNLVWANQLGGADENDFSYSIITTPQGNIYTTGYFSGSLVDFDFGLGTFTCTSNGSSDSFIHKMIEQGVGLKENYASSDLNIYPNPTANDLNISLTEKLFEKIKYNSKVELYNALGQLILKEPLTSKHLLLNTDGLSKGIYIVNITKNDAVIISKKIIKD